MNKLSVGSQRRRRRRRGEAVSERAGEEEEEGERRRGRSSRGGSRLWWWGSEDVSGEGGRGEIGENFGWARVFLHGARARRPRFIVRHDGCDEGGVGPTVRAMFKRMWGQVEKAISSVLSSKPTPLGHSSADLFFLCKEKVYSLDRIGSYRIIMN
uniref:Uncharacterized protein n=1 Tax=Leersia perrieri TaxID=77586 RepID=A0A0D9X0U8_9ORYZ